MASSSAYTLAYMHCWYEQQKTDALIVIIYNKSPESAWKQHITKHASLSQKQTSVLSIAF